jgi:FtsZ-binding cell division protein ZapB
MRDTIADLRMELEEAKKEIARLQKELEEQKEKTEEAWTEYYALAKSEFE